MLALARDLGLERLTVHSSDRAVTRTHVAVSPYAPTWLLQIGLRTAAGG